MTTKPTIIQISEGVTLHIYGNRKQEWYKNGKIHRDDDQPAIIHESGTKEWYKYGERHRDNDQPAIITANGSKEWYKEGKHHREGDQPAIITSSGSKYWYHNGKPHRDNNQPAIIKSNGSQYWYKNGESYNPALDTLGNSRDDKLENFRYSDVKPMEKKETLEALIEENKRLREVIAQLAKLVNSRMRISNIQN